MATANFNIQPEDGWVAVTDDDVDFIKIRQSPRSQPFYVTTGTTPPAITVKGYLVDCEEFWVDVPITAGEFYYVRTVKANPDQDTRIDVFSIPTTP